MAGRSNACNLLALLALLCVILVLALLRGDNYMYTAISLIFNERSSSSLTADVCKRPIITGSKIRHLNPNKDIFWTNYTSEWDQFMDILYIPEDSPISGDTMTCQHWVVVTGTAGGTAADIQAFMDINLKGFVHSPCVAYVTAATAAKGHYGSNAGSKSIKALEGRYAGRFKLLDLAYINELGKAIAFVKMMASHTTHSDHALRNIGYMYVMLHGAKTIVDMHIDMRVKEGAPLSLLQLPGEALRSPTNGVQVRKVRHDADHKEPRLELDIYPLMGAVAGVRARGYPLASNSSTPPAVLADEAVTIESSSVYAVSSLIDKYPDTDSQLKQASPPFKIQGNSANSILLPKGLYAPYSALSTLHFQSSFWTMFIPVTIPTHEADIVRSFVTERLSQDIPGAHILFSEPLFERALPPPPSNNALTSFDERALQSRMHLLARKLREFHSTSRGSRCAQSRIEELYALLYELGFVEITDFQCLFYWLRAFFAVKSPYPVLKDHTHPKVGLA